MLVCAADLRAALSRSGAGRALLTCDVIVLPGTSNTSGAAPTQAGRTRWLWGPPWATLSAMAQACLQPRQGLAPTPHLSYWPAMPVRRPHWPGDSFSARCHSAPPRLGDTAAGAGEAQGEEKSAAPPAFESARLGVWWEPGRAAGRRRLGRAGS